MEILLSAALGAALSAALSRGATPRADRATELRAPVVTARIPVRERALGAEETVARLDAMIRALDAPRGRGDSRAR